MIVYALKNLVVHGPRGDPPIASLAGKLENWLMIIVNLHDRAKQINAII